jgi:hypothetical protein
LNREYWGDLTSPQYPRFNKKERRRKKVKRNSSFLYIGIMLGIMAASVVAAALGSQAGRSRLAAATAVGAATIRTPNPVTTLTEAQIDDLVAERIHAARKTIIDPHKMEFYSMNWFYSGATLTFRNRGRVYVRKFPKFTPKILPLIPGAPKSERVVFENTEPEKGFTLTVTTADGKKVVFSSQPIITKYAMESGYLHVCDGPHLSFNGVSGGIWPVGHEGDVREWYESQSCADNVPCSRSFVGLNSIF